MNNVVPAPQRAHLAMHQQGGGAVPSFESMGQIVDFAKAMATSDIGVRKHLRGNHGACIAVCLQSQRWGMDPFAVANKSYLVNDQIAYEAQLIAAVINTRAPIIGRLKVRYEGEGQNRRCIAYAQFRGDNEVMEAVSPPFGQITPKNSPLWKSDPDQQLAYYTQRLWARRYCPEVLLGVYDVEEVEASAAHQGPDHARDVTPTTPRPSRERIAREMAADGAQIAPPVYDAAPPATPAPEPAFTLVTADGEEVPYWSAHAAAEAFEAALAAGGMGVWESNEHLRAALLAAGAPLPLPPAPLLTLHLPDGPHDFATLDEAFTAYAGAIKDAEKIVHRERIYRPNADLVSAMIAAGHDAWRPV